MNVETLIYAYLAICSSMIVFNCACIFVFRRRSVALQKRSSYLERQIAGQIKHIEAGEPVEDGHKQYLQKKLQQIKHLMAFDETLERLLGQEPDAVWKYLGEIAPIFAHLSLENKYRNVIHITYFAYIIKKYRVIQGKPASPVISMMMKLLQEPGLYCRENAMQAICSSGDCICVLHALQTIDQGQWFHHEKMLTDNLLAFSGDSDHLASTLWNEFSSFSVQMRVVILDYIRFSGRNMQEELLQLLADSRQDDEIRFSCIRYFGKVPYEPAFPLLVTFLENPNDNRWEYAAISATALASYPCERSIEVLKKALSNSNWYIRFNASKSLECFHLSYLELSDVMDGNDRYAREILQYRMDLKKARQEQGAALV